MTETYHNDSEANPTITIEKPVPPTPDPRIRQWVLTVIVALGAGVGAKEALGSTMAAVAGGLSGVLASYVLDWLRVLLYEGVNGLAKKTGQGGMVGRTLAYLLYNPKGIRLTTVGITLVLGAVAAGVLDWTTGKPISMAVASAWAFVGSQVAHLRSLPSQPTHLTAKRATLEKEISPPIVEDTDFKTVEQSGIDAWNRTPGVVAETREELRARLETVEQGSVEYYDILSNLVGLERQAAVRASEQPKQPE